MESVLVGRLSMRCILWLALSASVSACGVDNTAPSGGYVGTWRLRTVNGQSLPFDEGAGLVIVSQEVVIQKDGSFASNASSTLGGQQVVKSYQGSCALSATTQLECTTADGSAFAFVWQGDSLYTSAPSGFLSVYRR